VFFSFWFGIWPRQSRSQFQDKSCAMALPVLLLNPYDVTLPWLCLHHVIQADSYAMALPEQSHCHTIALTSSFGTFAQHTADSCVDPTGILDISLLKK